MRNRDIVFVLKMRNQAQQAIRGFGSGFRQAAAEARKAAREAATVMAAFDGVAGAARSSSASAEAAAENMRRMLQRLAEQARAAAVEIRKAFNAKPTRQQQSPAPQTQPGGGGSPIPGLSQALASAQAGLQGLRNLALGLGSTLAAGLGADKVLSTADAYSALQSQIKLVTTSAEQQAAVYERVFAISQNTRTDLSDNANLYSRLAQATRNYGLTGNQVLDVTDAIGKSIAIFGGNTASAQAGLFQLTQGLASGALRGEEFNSVVEQTPRLAQAIGDGIEAVTGKAVGNLRKMAEEGKLTTDLVVKALLSQRGRLDVEFGKVDKTAGQAFVVLGNAVTDFIGRADKATGASRGFADAVTSMAATLRDPAMTRGAVTAMSLFGSAMQGVVGGIRTLLNHIDLVVAAMAFLAGRAAGNIFAGLVASVMSAVSAVRTLASTMSVASAAMTVAGGPFAAISAVIGLAAGALAYFGTSSSSSERAGDDLTRTIGELRKAYDQATGSVKGLTDAQRENLTGRLKGQIAELAASVRDETTKALKGISAGDNILPTVLFDPTKTAAKFAPFREQIEALRVSAAAGVPDMAAFETAVAGLMATSNDPALQKAGSELLRLVGNLATTTGRLSQAQDALRGLSGDTEAASRSFGKLTDTLDTPTLKSTADHLQIVADKMRELQKLDPDARKHAEAFKENEAALATYKAALDTLNLAYRLGEVDVREYTRRAAELGQAFEKAKAGISGATEAARRFKEASADLRIDAMGEGRARALEQIAEKYRRMEEQTRREITDQRELATALQQVAALRGQEVANLDTKYRTGALADRLRDLRDEARLIDLSGDARDRMQRQLEMENEARRAGVSNIRAFVDAYMAEFDTLKRRQDAYQADPFNGLRSALTKFREEASKVADATEKAFSNAFDSVSGGLAEMVVKGKADFASMMQSFAVELAKAQIKKLLAQLVDGVGGSGGLSGLLAGAASAFGFSASGKPGSTDASTLGAAAQVIATGVKNSVSAAVPQIAQQVAPSVSSALAPAITNAVTPAVSQATNALAGLGYGRGGAPTFFNDRIYDTYATVNGRLDQAMQQRSSEMASALATAKMNVEAGFKATSDALSSGASGIADAVGSLLKSFSGSGGGSGLMGLISSAASTVTVNHKGGIVGRNNGMLRTVRHALWANAPRFHSGGVPGAGLRNGERAIIAKDDEAIFPTVRLPSGGYGIKGVGGGGGGRSVSLSIGDIKITQQSSGNREDDERHSKETGLQVREQLMAIVHEVLIDEQRNGGLLRKTSR